VLIAGDVDHISPCAGPAGHDRDERDRYEIHPGNAGWRRAKTAFLPGTAEWFDPAPVVSPPVAMKPSRLAGG
jgi:hypothetical protein